MIRLPDYLEERTHRLNDLAPRADGEFVLYWMHHAVRGHENAALDTACELARVLKKPVLVYQGLGGRHRYNADRHHAFILEGAAEVARELDALGVDYAFHLPTDPSVASPLAQLIDRACALVVEDFPAPPFPRWTAQWAKCAKMAVFAVDAALIVPIRCKPKSFDRAYAFRDALKEEFARRVSLAWPAFAAPPLRFSGELGFAALDFARLDLGEAIAACQIDHAIAPCIEHTGGSTAGYQRWHAFRDGGGLDRYAELRNDAATAPPMGVSRLSPYLHHGHISALRLAREAEAKGSLGAAKFLDELFVWRELAFNFCLHSRDPEHFKALPPWAQATLSAHASDRREVIAEADLARAKSPAKLWNLFQQSLLKHGELHNNVRMTWGKAIAYWRPNPQAALRTLVDLNHRYALDGNNPNSYAGLLWCLGLFDSPHTPEVKVLGSVRTRPLHVHSNRLDQVAYAAHIGRPALGAQPSIAVIGAGMAGLAAARTLSDQGLAVTVFDKGQVPGGRIASKTRGVPGGDHGAPWFTARHPDFVRMLQPLLDAGHVASWRGRFVRLTPAAHEPLAAHTRFVGKPSMNALPAALASELNVRCGVEIEHVAGGRLYSAGGADQGHFDFVLVTVPPKQALKLIDASAPLHALASSAQMQPCWTALISAVTPPALDFDAAFVEGFGLRLIVNESSKPGRTEATFVVHADPDFSALHLDAEPEAVAGLLAQALDRALGGKLGPVAAQRAHRWRYAQALEPQASLSALDFDEGLGLAGDWLADGRIEGAWLSGVALAGRLMTQLVLRNR